MKYVIRNALLVIFLTAIAAHAFALETYICGIELLDENMSGCVKVPDESIDEPVDEPIKRPIDESVKVHYAESDYENEQHGAL